ncbi:hypothetical protein [Desulfurivibrio alkaliphilus]|uniref:hypothetical protein n=1 Tax=Desulfurivibrio alkaliphilus TaxID=427923 RepID=UPI00138A62FD|nr:hypothetical protein [Desulfurivibrio alkaliphilus]
MHSTIFSINGEGLATLMGAAGSAGRQAGSAINIVFGEQALANFLRQFHAGAIKQFPSPMVGKKQPAIILAEQQTGLDHVQQLLGVKLGVYGINRSLHPSLK